MMPSLTHDEWQAIRLSVLVSLTAVAATLAPGIALGWVLARRRFRCKAVVETLLNLPLVMPPVVTGYVLLVTCGRHGPIGRALESLLGVRLVFDWKGAAIASAVMAFPLMVRSIRLAFTTVDPRLELAARTLGRGPINTFMSVSLPLAMHGVVAGGVLAFARGMGEFGATIMIAGNIPGQTRTIPLLIYTQLETPGGVDSSARLVLVSILIAGLALAAGEAIERRGRRRLQQP